jgi:8-oxo-dGTP diphosphatase
MAVRVVGAVIVRDGLVLAARRGRAMALAGKWEFPGGKVESDESPKGALSREIAEELGCSISVGRQVMSTTHEYDFGVIELDTYYASIEAGEPRASEHAEIRWLAASDLAGLDWAPADVPAVAQILEDLTNRGQPPA